MISIDEQIARQEAVIRHCEGKVGVNIEGDKAILASLERLKAIDAVQVPEYPKINYTFIEKPFSGEGENIAAALKVDYDTLRDLLKKESARADAPRLAQACKVYGCQKSALWFIGEQNRDRAEAAESINAAMLKLGENPSFEMKLFTLHYRDVDTFKKMFAKLVEQAEAKK